jgi:hypothetical protein
MGAQYHAYQARCRYKKGGPIPFEIQHAEFVAILAHACHYCGTTERRRGLDRLEPALGYLLTNVVPACALCNRMRMDMGYSAFLAHVRAISTHRDA